MKTVVGLFKDIRSAEQAVDEFAAIGLDPRRIGLMSSPQVCAEDLPPTPMHELYLRGLGRVAVNQSMLDLLDTLDLLGVQDALEKVGLGRDDADRCIEGVKRGGTLEAVAVEEDMAAQAAAIMCRNSGARDGIECWNAPACVVTRAAGGWERLRRALRARRARSGRA